MNLPRIPTSIRQLGLKAGSVALLMSVAFAAPAHAEDAAGPDGAAKQKRHKRGQIFQRLDKNGDGQLTQDEVPERLWERLVQADTDGDGAISKDEAKAARKQHMKRRGQRGRRAQRPAARGQRMVVLSRFDTNQDGALTGLELADAQAAISSMQQHPAAERGQGGKRGQRGRGGRRGKRKPGKLFEKFDKDGDGALTADEVPEKLWERISKADADGDGKVTKDELKAAHEARRGKRKGKQAPETPDQPNEG